LPVYSNAVVAVMQVERGLRSRPAHSAQFVLTQGDKRSKQMQHDLTRLSKANKRAECAAAEVVATAAIHEWSSMLHCEVPGCEYASLSEAAFARHRALSAEQHVVCRIEKDSDVIIRGCVAATAQVKFCSSRSSVEDTDRCDSIIYPASEFTAQHLCSGARFDIKASRPAHAFARKSTALQVKMSAETWEFVLYCQGRGDKAVGGGPKTLGHQAAQAMRLWGTAKGAEIFNLTEADRTFMQPNETNTRKVKMGFLKDAQQLKAYMRMDRELLLASRDRLVEKRVEEERRAADPVRKRVFDLSGPDLHKKFTAIMTLKSAAEAVGVPRETVDLFAVVGALAPKPKILKPLFLQVIELGRRAERDLAILRKKGDTSF